MSHHIQVVLPIAAPAPNADPVWLAELKEREAISWSALRNLAV